jgi:hypothetical protein
MSWTKNLIEALGILFGLYGTYLMATGYLAISFPTFLVRFTKLLSYTITFRKKKFRNELGTLAETGNSNLEDRYRIVEGLIWLFAGFLFAMIALLLELFR